MEQKYNKEKIWVIKMMMIVALTLQMALLMVKVITCMVRLSDSAVTKWRNIKEQYWQMCSTVLDSVMHIQ